MTSLVTRRKGRLLPAKRLCSVDRRQPSRHIDVLQERDVEAGADRGAGRRRVPALDEGRARFVAYLEGSRVVRDALPKAASVRAGARLTPGSSG